MLGDLGQHDRAARMDRPPRNVIPREAVPGQEARGHLPHSVCTDDRHPLGQVVAQAAAFRPVTQFLAVLGKQARRKVDRARQTARALVGSVGIRVNLSPCKCRFQFPDGRGYWVLVEESCQIMGALRREHLSLTSLRRASSNSQETCLKMAFPADRRQPEV